jgi:formate C-acetyltransferase
MGAVCRRVPALPARTFREAINAVWLSEVGIHAENINMAMSPGRLDQVLYPWFRRDMDEGRLDLATALELVGSLWLKLADNVDMVPEASEQLFGGAGSVPAVTLGGVDAEGGDAVNDLTYVMLRATELLRIRDPNVNARVHVDVNPRAYRDRVAEVILETKAVPAMYNDAANIAALQAQGETPAHARDYAVIGCVELSSAGREYTASSSIILNLVAALELALHRGKRPLTGDEQIGPKTPLPCAMRSFAEFEAAFHEQLDWLIAQAVGLNEQLGAVHQEVMPSPLLSAFLEGPLERGRDAVQGGALYNSSGATHIGFADVVDSLSAIEDLVFGRKLLGFGELLDALGQDFAGPAGERVRGLVRQQAPKYGTSHPIAQRNAKALVRHLFERYQSYRNYRGGPYRPAYWTMTNHAGLGGITGALPNGRRASEPFASGITPVSGAAPDLYDALDAVAALGGPEVAGGWALNLKYTPERPEQDAGGGADAGPSGAMVQRFGAAAEGYFRKGGHQVQFNVMTRAMLEEARANPDRYPELMVRVSGYSAYFKDLNDKMKQELIERAEYDLATGREQP